MISSSGASAFHGWMAACSGEASRIIRTSSTATGIPGVGFAEARPGKGCRVANLPPQRGVVARIAGEDALQHRRTGAGEANHNERGLDVLVFDLGVACEPVFRAQSRNEALENAAPHVGASDLHILLSDAIHLRGPLGHFFG